MSWFSKLFSKPEPIEKPEPDCLVYCVPQSISCAWAWAVNKKLPVRIAVSKISIDPNEDHSQAETLYGNQWRPLIMDWTDKGPVVKIGNRHFDVEPYRYYTLTEWIDSQIQYTE